MKKVLCLLATLATSSAHAHTDTPLQTGTTVSGALAVTWRDEGAPLNAGVWQIPGVLMGGEAYPVEEGPALDDATLIVRHLAASGVHGLIQIASHDNGREAELHHAFAGYRFTQTTFTLNVEGGRMAALMSPGNGEHASTRPFSETPLVLDGFLGRQLNDEGLRAQLQWQGWEVGVEGWRGSAFPATSGEEGGSHDLYLQHRGQFAALAWHSGLWWLRADALNRSDTRYDSGHRHGGSSDVILPELWFDGRSESSGAFARLRWQIMDSTALHLAAEWLRLDADGTLRDPTRKAGFSSDSNGGWVETRVQIQRHEAGLRWERLALDNTFTGAAAEALANLSGVYNEHDPERLTLLYRWQLTPSFALRAEWIRDDTFDSRSERVALGLVWHETLWSPR